MRNSSAAACNVMDKQGSCPANCVVRSANCAFLPYQFFSTSYGKPAIFNDFHVNQHSKVELW